MLPRKPYPNLANPPIKEALIELRTPEMDIESISGFERLSGTLSERYPHRVIQMQTQSKVFDPDWEESFTQTIKPRLSGYLFQSSTKDKAYQRRRNGFAVNLVGNYISWDDLRSEAEMLWNDFVEITGVDEIIYIGLRYINNFEVPLPFRFDQYFRTRPVISEDLPYEVAPNLLFHFTLIKENDKIYSNITQSISKIEQNTEALSITFDIDVGKQEELGMVKIWEDLEKMRAFKNEIFFESLTNSTIDKFR